MASAALAALAGSDRNNQLGVAIFFVVPILLAGLGAFTYGVFLTVRFPRPTLVALNVTTLSLVAVGIALTSNVEPAPRPFNAIPWDPHTPCSTNWTAQENLFLKSDGSKVSGCVNTEDIELTGKILMLPDPNLRIDPGYQPPPRVQRQSRKNLFRLGVALACFFTAVNLLTPAWWFAVGRRLGP
jgi:hypothetical protein